MKTPNFKIGSFSLMDADEALAMKNPPVRKVSLTPERVAEIESWSKKTTNPTAEHTPGPWTVDTRLTGHRYNGEPVTYYSIAHTSLTRDCYIATEIAPVTLITGSGEVHNEEGAANARLIASAPALLAALQELTAAVPLRTLNVRKDFSVMVAHAAATKAIHLATGGDV